jgi:hypothetical protein
LLLWLGGTGPKIRELLSNWLSADVKRENEKLRAELAALTIKQIPNSNQVPTVTSALRPVYTLGFDYLPAATPLQRGWKQEYNNDGVAEFDSDPDIPGSLRMKILKSEVAIHHNLPPHATLADHLEYTAKYAITTMIFARLIVSTRDGSVQPKVDFKFRYGRLQCMSTNPNPNPGDPSKWLPEQTISWPAEQLAGGRLAFNIDLREAVKVCLGSQGWVFKSIEGVRPDCVRRDHNLRRAVPISWVALLFVSVVVRQRTGRPL